MSFSCRIACLTILVAAAAAAEPTLSLGPVWATIDSTAQIELRVTGAEESYIGFNAKVILPAGVAPVSVDRGPLLSDTFAFESNAFVEAGASGVSILAYSLQEAIAPQDGVLAIINVQVTDDPVAAGIGAGSLVEHEVRLAKSGLAAYDGETSLPHVRENGLFTISSVPLALLSISPSSLQVPSALGDYVLEVANAGTAAGMAWTASVVAGGEWLSIDQGSGIDVGQVLVHVAVNSVEEPRTATIRIDAGDVVGSPALVTVVQAGDHTPILAVDPVEYELSSISGILEVGIRNTGNGDLNWTASVVQGVDWLSVSSAPGVEGSNLTLAFTSNTTVVPRVGLVVVEAPGALNERIVLTCIQRAPAVLSVLPQLRAVGAAGGTAEFNIENRGGATLNWTAQVVAGLEWATLESGASGQDDGLITIAYPANAEQSARSATIRIESPGVAGSPFDVALVQAGNNTPLLSVMPAQATVLAQGGNCEFAVSNAGNGTMRWSAEVQSGQEWLNVASGAAGENSGSVRLTVLPNREAGERVGTVVVTAPGADNSPVTLTVTQKSFEPLTIVSPNGGENLKRNVAFPITWSSAGATKSVNAVAINLWQDGNLKNVIITTTKNSGTHPWGIPANIEPGRNYQIQIVDVNDASVCDESDEMFAIACPPDVPSSVAATDGEEGSIRLTWGQVDSATSYEVYRSSTDAFADAQLIATTSSPVFEDKDAERPKWEPGVSCAGMQTTSYWYWVKSVNGCDSSPESMPDDGYRGKDRAEIDTVYSKVLPGDPASDQTLAAHRSSVLSIRLRHDDGIRPESVMGSVEWDGNKAVTSTWQAMNETDGWVVYTPTASWPVGAEVTFTASAQTLGGEPVGPVSYTFTIVSDDVMPAAKEAAYVWQPGYSDFDSSGLDLPAESNQNVGVRAEEDALVPALVNGVGGAYVVDPPVPFETPRRVWLPVPEGLAESDATLYYYHQDPEEAGWYPAAQVLEWVVPDSYLVIESHGVRYLGFLVRHGGLIRLGDAAAAPSASVETAASVVPSFQGLGGDTLLLTAALTVLIMGGLAKRRQDY